MRTVVVSLVVALVGLGGPAGAQQRSDSDRIWIVPAVKRVSSNPGLQKFSVAVMIDNSTGAAAITLPFTFAGHPGLRIDTSVFTPPDMRGVTYGPGGGSDRWTVRTSLPNNARQTILLGFVRWDRSGTRVQHDTLCYIHFELDAGGVTAQAPLDTTFLPPGNFLTIVDTTAYDRCPIWTLGLIDIAPLSAGDLNGDGMVTTSDIILVVKLVTDPGSAPASWAPADANCDGTVSLADAVWLVNFVFKSGPEPIAPCALWKTG